MLSLGTIVKNTKNYLEDLGSVFLVGSVEMIFVGFSFSLSLFAFPKNPEVFPYRSLSLFPKGITSKFKITL